MFQDGGGQGPPLVSDLRWVQGVLICWRISVEYIKKIVPVLNQAMQSALEIMQH